MRATPSCVAPAVRRRSLHQALLAAAVLAAVAASATAQVQFENRQRDRLRTGDGPRQAVALGDVDGDGDLDLVLGSLGQQNLLFLNDGNGRFMDVTAAQMPADIDATRAIACADVDGDGDLDLVVGNYNQQSRLYLNNGAGTFTNVPTGMPGSSYRTRAIALGDVDGDGDLDLVVGNQNQQSRLYVNDGLGSFTDATATQLPAIVDYARAVALGDVDGDGDLDLVVGNGGSSQNRLYLNNGAGTFNDATAAKMPVGYDPTEAVALGDVDGDGDLDLVVGNSGTWWYGYYFVADNGLLLNDGTGTFTAAAASQLPTLADITGSVVLGDVDGDGDLDLFLGNGYVWSVNPNVFLDGQDRLLLNDGSGTFTDATARLPLDNDQSVDAVFGDLDADGDLDLVVAVEGGWSRRSVNLHQHLAAPQALTCAAPYTLEAYLRCSAANGFAFPAMSLGAASITLPPYGTLGIDLATAVTLPMITIPQPAGVGSVTVAVPNVPGLLGLEVWSQAMFLPLSGPARLSNVVGEALTIAPTNLVVNGDFESPVVAPNATAAFASIPGWSLSSGCGVDVWNRPDYALRGQFAEFDSTCSSAFFQDVPTTAGRSYLLSVGYTHRPFVLDNSIQVRWGGATVFSLLQLGTILPTTSWSMHRALVTATASTQRLEFADTSPADDHGGFVDEVSVVEIDFLSSRWLVGEVVYAPVDVQTLRGFLQQAETAHANNNPVAKAAALAAFVSHVNALPAGTVTPVDAALLVAVASVL